MRTRRVALLMAALSVAGSACAPLPGPKTTRPAAPAAAPPSQSALLWRVTRDGAVSHVFGTIHAGRSLDVALGRAGQAALAAATTVVVEVDLNAPETTAALTTLVAERGRLPAGRSLDALVSPPTWTWLVASLDDRFPEPSVRRLQPWLAVYVVIGTRAATALQPSGTSGGPAAPVPMDRVLAARAQAHGQRVVALETAAEQVSLLADMPEDVATQFLEETARDPAALDRQIRGLVDDTSGPGAADAVETMVERYVAESPAMAEAMFFARNRAWVPRLRPLLDDGGAFVAVGAGHLVGDRGLISLLEEAGYEVVQARP